MQFARWFRSGLDQLLCRNEDLSATKGRSRGSRRKARGPLRVEKLEDRLAPATLYWTGVGSNWDDPNNWSGGSPPTPADDVVINRDLQPAVTTVTVNASTRVASLLVTPAFAVSVAANQVLSVDTLRLDGGEITGAGGVTVAAFFSWRGGTLSGSGSLVVAPTGTFHLAFGLNVLYGGGHKLQVQGRRTQAVWTPADVDETGPSPTNPTLYVQANADESPYNTAFDNAGVPPSAPAAAPPGELTGEQADELAYQIHEAMYGGIFGAGVDKEAVYSALANRSREDVDLIAEAYRLRYSTPAQARVMQTDLSSQWGISFSTIDSTRINELLAGNQPGADAAQIRGILGELRIPSFGYIIREVRDILYRGDPDAIADAYARLYPAGARMDYPHGARPPEELPRLRYDVQFAFNFVEAFRPQDRPPAYLDEVRNYNQSVNLLFEGNLAGSDAAKLRGLRAVVLNGGSEDPHERMTGFLESRSPGELAAIDAEYRRLYSTSVLDSLDARAFAHERDLFEVLRSGNRYDGIAVRLRHAFDQDRDGSTDDSDGTDEEAVWTALDGLYADERAMVAQGYRQRYNEALLRKIEDEFSDNIFDGPELEKTVKLFTHGGLSAAERVYYAVSGWGTDDDAIRRAMGDLRQMDTAQIASAQQEYGRLVPGSTLGDAFYYDLSGSFYNDARLSLEGRITTVEQYYQLARRRYDYERGANAWNGIGNFVSGINTQGGNLDRTWEAIQAAYDGVASKADPIDQHPAFRRVVLRIEQDLQSYRGFRGAAAEVAANVAATAAGILVLLTPAGSFAPLLLAVTAGVTGAATQALTRMGIAGTFTWEELPADLVVGAVGGVSGAFSFPAATHGAGPSGVRVGVLRAAAGSPFVGGAAVAGLSTAFKETTWQDDFAVGVANIVAASAIGGFATSALARVPGAALSLARTTGVTALTRRIATTTGSEVVQVFSATFHRSIRQAVAEGQSFAQAMGEHLASFTQRLDDVSRLLFDTTPTETVANVRQLIRNLLAGDDWPPFAFEGVVDAGTELWWSSQREFVDFGVQGIRDRLLNGLQQIYNSISGSMDDLLGRLNGGTAGGFTHEQAERIAERFAGLQSADDAAIRTVLLDVLGQTTTITDVMLSRVRGWVGAPRTIPPAGQRGIWDIASDHARGSAAEDLLGGRTGLPFEFPVIDRFENGVAISVKTINLGLKSYQKLRQIISIGEKYIDEASGFAVSGPETRAGVTIRPDQVTQRAIDLVVPPWTTQAQREALEQLVQYGRRLNPSVLVRIVELQ